MLSPNPGYIELNRTFHELTKHANERDDFDISGAFRVGESLCWRNLIKEYRLILLSEAGAGKTTEIHNVACALKEEGKPAFFLRLEYIPRDFEDSFEVGTYEGFEKWLQSGEEGWLLLDSVDEARLRDPGDFELAIRKLSRRISKSKDRTHIVITGRTTAWRPITDLACCTANLPYSLANTTVSNPIPDGDNARANLQTESNARGENTSVFKIVALDDLTSDQIALFVKKRGIEDSRAFLDAVERADAWSFTARPQDLDELIEFWVDKRRIGNRLEILRNSIDRRLTERDQGRADAYPLSAERAHEGARILAAATTLTQEPSIRVPDGAENTKGIVVESMLPDWNGRDRSTLLSRPIFDEAIYGAVRFHHRSVREYLAAEWFAELLKGATSRRTIEGLFFRNQYGIDIVAPMLRPILPWLAILDDKIRERIRKIAPEIILEGGDPSQLPLEIRRHILHEVCEQMASRANGRLMRGFEAVQHFSSTDLTDDIRLLLRQYANNEDIKAFLLRMVWIGQLAGALPETMEFSIIPKTDLYTRIVAFKAIKAIGSKEDQEQVRKCFLAEASTLKRELLSELLDGIQPTKLTLDWLFECLEKCEAKERFTFDNLANSVTKFVDATDVELLPQLVMGMNRLLTLPPIIDYHYCEISEKLQWLIAPASKAVERLIAAHHPAALEPDALSILHNIPAVRNFGSNDLAEVKIEFSKLVPAWKELNRRLFWHSIQRTRQSISKQSGERLTYFWRASVFGAFWKFEECDYEYVVEEISRQPLLDNKLVALSLAFEIYKLAKRPRAWRARLKDLVASHNELSKQLNTFFRPPAQNRDSRRWKQQEAKWRKQQEATKRKEGKFHADWKKYLLENIDEARSALRNRPGVVTNVICYLLERTRNDNRNTGRWTDYNWKTLIPEYGEKVARFYRDSTVDSWRQHKPRLRSQGAPPNQTTYAVIIGLTGLEIEANETKAWPKSLSSEEVQLACRYASFELNGFPTWFPKLFEAHPKIVCNFLMREIQYELSIETSETETHYIISDISWSGQWTWDQIAPNVYELLKKREPKNPTNLDKLLRIVQGSNISDDLIKELAARKCRTLKKLDHVARWFAVWTGVAPDSAISSLAARLGKIKDSRKRTMFSMTFLTHLWGGRLGDRTAVRQAFKTPEYLKSLYLLMHQHIRRKEDIHRDGAYSPGLRDFAQDARDSLFELLMRIPGKESFLAVMQISELHPEEASRQWMMHLARTKAEQDGDIRPWSPSQVKDFHDKLDRTPSNHRELSELAILRFMDLKDNLENGDSSIASILQTVKQETDIRKYIGAPG